MPMKVFCYHEPIQGFKQEEEIIDLWRESWAKHGWEPVVNSASDALKYPGYDRFLEAVWKHPTVNPKQYELACYRRWAAMAACAGEGALMTDYDVMNFGFRPEYAIVNPDKLTFYERGVPSAVLGNSESFTRACNVLAAYKRVPSDRTNGKPHLSDMIIFQRLGDGPLIKTNYIMPQFGDKNWQTATLVHFPNSRCNGDKVRAIRGHPVRRSRQLLVIFNVGEEDSICEAFLPYWRKSECDLLFSSPVDMASTLKGVEHFRAGVAMSGRKEDYWKYQSRVLDTMKHVLGLDYDAYYFTQTDSVALGPLPVIQDGECVHHLAGGPQTPFKSSFFLHPPWGFSKLRLKQFVEAAAAYPIQSTEFGIMDRWISLIIEEQGIPFTPSKFSWSSNAIDTPALVESARAAIKKGALFVHGCKNPGQLQQILAA